jgi:hypothetical protein
MFLSDERRDELLPLSETGMPAEAMRRLEALGITTLEELRDTWTYGNRQLLTDYLGESPVRFTMFRPSPGLTRGAAAGPGKSINLSAAGPVRPLVKRARAGPHRRPAQAAGRGARAHLARRPAPRRGGGRGTHHAHRPVPSRPRLGPARHLRRVRLGSPGVSPHQRVGEGTPPLREVPLLGLQGDRRGPGRRGDNPRRGAQGPEE